jgi:hypothetical protein
MANYHEAQEQQPLPSGDVVLVVHGFNCTALDGIVTARRVRDSLKAWGFSVTAPGAEQQAGGAHVIGFTWPCEHTLVPGYMDDKATVARFAAFSFANLLLKLRQKDPERHIHVVAHSMGCFLTLKALNMLAVLNLGRERTPTLPVVNQLIWLAPDVNADALERSTPETEQVGHWLPISGHPRLRRPMRRLRLLVQRPQPLPPARTRVRASTARTGEGTPRQWKSAHPLDGYGYAALNAIDALRSYSSFYDQALAVAPWANHTTEEGASASGAIRLGWCGPLHPALTLPQEGDTPIARPHRLSFVECSQVVHEHGDYFFATVVQRDLASNLYEAQHPNHPPKDPRLVMSPPDRVQLTAWHNGTPLQTLAEEGKRTRSTLEYFALAGAPPSRPTKGWTTLGLAVWHSFVGHSYVWCVRRLFDV